MVGEYVFLLLLITRGPTYVPETSLPQEVTRGNPSFGVPGHSTRQSVTVEIRSVHPEEVEKVRRFLGDHRNRVSLGNYRIHCFGP